MKSKDAVLKIKNNPDSLPLNFHATFHSSTLYRFLMDSDGFFFAPVNIRLAPQQRQQRAGCYFLSGCSLQSEGKEERERESGGERRWWRGEGESSRCCHSSNQRYFSPLKRTVDPARHQKSFSTKASAGYFAPTMLERKEPSEVPTGSTALLTVCLSSCDASVRVRRTQKGSSAPVIVNQLEVSHREQRAAEI